MSTNYVHLGARGKFHIEVNRCGQTVCGKPVPDEVRTTIYKPALCARCAADKDAVDAAERTRTKHWKKVEKVRRDARDIVRKGVFTVYRCRLCGVQHLPSGRGVPWCELEHHVAELEEVVAQGPAWVDPAEAIA